MCRIFSDIVRNAGAATLQGIQRSVGLRLVRNIRRWFSYGRFTSTRMTADGSSAHWHP